MLGQITKFCSILNKNAILKNSTSVVSIFQTIRSHFGFKTLGAHIIDILSIKYEVDERPADLWVRLISFIEDCLLKQGGRILHHGEAPASEEEQYATLESFVVIHWLQLIHKDLPNIVKQRYGTQLNGGTVAGLREEIAQVLPSFSDEIKTSEDVRSYRAAMLEEFDALRIGGFQRRSGFKRGAPTRDVSTQKNRPNTRCELCSQVGQSPTDHWLSRCPFLPDS